MDSNDLRHLKRTLELAQNGTSEVFPNPRVGALVVRDGKVVGEGWHRRCGGPHAEVEAIGDLDLKGCTVYVSLEPCAHEGRTPSCAKTLVERGAARVVYAMEDPGPGEGGGEILKAGNVEVSGPHPDALSREVLMPFLRNIKGACAITLKWAMTLDGRIALESGDSKWITSEAARRHVHRVRSAVDGIMVGAGTVRADAPQLDVRHGVEGPSPRPVVWDPRGGTRSLGWWQSVEHRRPLVISDEQTAWPSGVEVIPWAKGADLPERLFRAGVHHLLVEGGAGCHGAMVDAGTFDRVLVYVAPKVCGGASSVSPVGGLGVAAMAQAHGLADLRYVSIGSDLLISACRESG